ncbi:MAG: hypothetical protein RL328_336 [Acidobacteriota bacterium]
MAGNRVKLFLGLACLAAQAWAQPQNRPIKRPLNNQLAIEGADTPTGRVDLPAATQGSARQLVFHVSPLSSKGLLSQQIEDALKALDKANGNATFLKLRAFVAGNGDLRRVQAVVIELFTARKWPLPALTTVQVGSLLQEGAQVVIESISEEKRTVNEGLTFLPAVEGASGSDAVSALAQRLGAATPLRITCFADSQAEAEAARVAATQQFPKAPGIFVQATRYTLGSATTCEAVAAGGNTGKLMLAGTQITFGEEQADLQLAFDRLEKVVAPLRLSTAIMTNLYGSSRAVADKARAMAPPATTSRFVEALQAPDATLAVEAVLPVP